MTTVESLPLSQDPEHAYTPDPEGMLVRDFFLSYKFSQGSSGGQQTMFEALAYFYADSLVETQKHELLEFVEHGFIDRASNLRLPTAHAILAHRSQNTRGELVRREFGDSAQAFSSWLKGSMMSDAVEPTHERKLELSTIIAEDMIYKDEEFMHKKRRIKSHTNVSFFREYVLLQTPTHSRAFDHIFGDINHSFNVGELIIAQDSLDKLAQDWETTHTNESFYPLAA